jgi:hypothetical protein
VIISLEKLWPYVNGMQAKPIIPIVAQIVTKTTVLPAIGACSIIEWDDKNNSHSSH